MTIIAAAIILSFTSIEFFDYRRVNVDTSIVVDRSRGEKLTANMNITFPRVPCYRECRIFLDPLPFFCGDMPSKWDACSGRITSFHPHHDGLHTEAETRRYMLTISLPLSAQS